MKKYEENMFAEYEEIKSARDGNIVSFSKKEYVRLKSTLDILEIGGYIYDLNIDGGHIYAIDECFEYFEDEMRAELGESDMVRRPDYSDLVNYKTPTQIRKENQENAIKEDIAKIETVINSDDEEELKKMHMIIDGKYNSYWC